MTDTIIRLISEIVTASMVRINEPMSRHTTFKIGGTADLLAEPSNMNQTEALLKLLKQLSIPYVVIGNGSNILVGDKGIRGVVIKIGNQFNEVQTDDNIITACAGVKLSRLASVACGNRLSGLEFAGGIPGTLGGALYMNAGAYGGEMKQVVKSVTYLDSSCIRRTIDVRDCAFGYRTSLFANDPGCVILGCTIELHEGNPEDIKARMNELAAKRNEKQPLNFPSAGSTFKRPEGAYAGKLIQDSGLMGARVGGASVSEKHAGFIVNDKGATAADVRELISLVQKKVKEDSGYDLLPEVRFIGEF